MQFSIVNGQRLKAFPRLIGNCPACGTPTRSKYGSIILWHWAHITTKHCDAWRENESEWHKEWKAQFQEDLQEVVQYDQSTGERHIADIKTNQGLVIELQHSAISIDELRSRESFYQNMIWIVDGRSFKDRFTIFPDRLPATKSSKGRAIPISSALESEIHDHYKNHGNGDKFFTSAYFAFRTALIEANLKHAEGQLSHILRHTFASHFMMNGGNVIVLQKILGHQSLTMTMRYAHFSPEHLQEVKNLNPMARLNLG